MNKPTYKVTIEDREALDLSRLKPFAHSWIAMLNMHGAAQPSFDDYLDEVVATMRVTALDDARAELAQHSRDHYLLNVYTAWDRTTYHVTITYVFSDRSTALLFRLSH